MPIVDPRFAPRNRLKFKRRRHYRSWRLTGDRDASIEDGIAASIDRRAAAQRWVMPAVWAFVVLPIVIASLVTPWMYGRNGSSAAVALFNASAIIFFCGAPVAAWMLIVRAIRVSLSPRPLADVVVIPAGAWFVSLSLWWLAWGLGGAAPFDWATPAIVTPFGALWGTIYWLAAGRPSPPYDD